MFMPASNHSQEALNAMLNSVHPVENGNDTDGSLSDSDDDCDMFLLAAPNCAFGSDPGEFLNGDSINPQARQRNKRTKHHGSRKPSNDESIVRFTSDLSVSSTTVTASNVSDPDHEGKGSTVPKCFSSGHLQKEESKSKFSNASLFGMDIIHEHSVSNVSLVGMSSELPHRGSTNDLNLRRETSEQSLGSIGLSLEGAPLYSECNSRDMVTPPVISRNTALSPPPLKETKLTADLFLGD